MFAEEEDEEFEAEGEGLLLTASAVIAEGKQGEKTEERADWDDSEGYLCAPVGARIGAGAGAGDGRYLVRGEVGRGVFSSVLRCIDTLASTATTKEGAAKEDARDNAVEAEEVAIKVVRNNETMRKAALQECEILREIATAADERQRAAAQESKEARKGLPHHCFYCIRLLDQLEYRGHVSLVFESMHMNLRETLRKFGKHVGLNIAGCRLYARQLLVALKHIGRLGIVHADLKPDNILVSADLKQIRLSDFGSAFKQIEEEPGRTNTEPTPYLVSRFYRAPEIVLFMESSCKVDMWSLGASLFELFTGDVLLNCANNNGLIRCCLELCGRLPNRIVRRHIAAYQRHALAPHFDDAYRFAQQELDPATGDVRRVRMVAFPQQPTRNVSRELLHAKAGSDDTRMVTDFANLLEKLLTLDPTQRIGPGEALLHALFATRA